MLTINSILSSSSNSDESITLQFVNAKSHLLYGLPDLNFIEPPIDPRLNHVDFVDLISDLYWRIMHSGFEYETRCLYLEQHALLCTLGDPKLLRRSLQSARAHVVDVHWKVVLSAWLRYKRRDGELVGVSALDCIGKVLECPKSALDKDGYHSYRGGGERSVPLRTGKGEAGQD
ncbi:hypothetical protein L1987_47628 [Smallanthus sonchifolius]|uniref:Uncharacterized protein n=1 Tax=Smallanthus sonchifolius TaxID=185202 RepID=A0ACB9G360_9ASTR|nr:hypothetical protein L1987_47628 [Smallanthus sonchifolius]